MTETKNNEIARQASENLNENETEAMIQAQTRIRASEVSNSPEAHKSFLIKEILESCIPEKQKVFSEQIEPLPNEFLTRLLEIATSTPESMKKIASGSWNTLRLVTFLEEFDNDKILWCLSLDAEATDKFDRFSFDLKKDLLNQAQDLSSLEQLVLNYKADADGGSGN